jgi:hypothetical protein
MIAVTRERPQTKLLKTSLTQVRSDLPELALREEIIEKGPASDH